MLCYKTESMFTSAAWGEGPHRRPGFLHQGWALSLSGHLLQLPERKKAGSRLGKEILLGKWGLMAALIGKQ